MFSRTCLAMTIGLLPLHLLAAPRFISIQGMPEFADAQAQLQVLMDTNGHYAENHFCIVGQRNGRNVQAFVSWPAEHALILWIPHLDDTHTLVNSKRYWNLDSDVLPGDDAHGSTYLLTRSFVNKVLDACHQIGGIFMIKRSVTGAAPNG